MAKSAQIQLRVTPQQKAVLQRRARAAGLDLTAYVLARLVPDLAARLQARVSALREPAGRRLAYAALHDLLAELAPATFAEATLDLSLVGLGEVERNRVAAMVEHAAHRLGVPPPAWCGDVEPLAHPEFSGGLRSLRPHLLRSSPVAFRRRNLFVDASIGARV